MSPPVPPTFLAKLLCRLPLATFFSVSMLATALLAAQPAMDDDDTDQPPPRRYARSQDRPVRGSYDEQRGAAGAVYQDRNGTRPAAQRYAERAPSRNARVRYASAEAPEQVPAPEPAPRGEYAEHGNGHCNCHGGAPAGEFVDGGPGCEEGCGNNGCGWCDDGGGCDDCDWGPLGDRLWVRTDYTMWWLSGAILPPLVTNGVLGTTGTKTLFGDSNVGEEMRSGGRLTVGGWLDDCGEIGIEGSFLDLANSTTRFHAASDGSTGSSVLARPYYSVRQTTTTASPGQAINLIASPGTLSGSVDVDVTSSFVTSEILMRETWFRECDSKLDFLAGYRYARLGDGVHMRSASTVLAGTGTGTLTSRTDLFDTDNTFNGGELGMAAEWRHCRLSLEMLGKVGIGSTHTNVHVKGATTTVTSSGTTTNYQGGLLALPSNMGDYSHNTFSIVPELGMTLGYDVTRHLRATFGYTVIYMSKVARAGDQIDVNVNSNLIPPAANATSTPPAPAFALHTTDFWAQGMNFGLEYKF